MAKDSISPEQGLSLLNLDDFKPFSKDYVPLESYKMDANPRGYCLVIDNHIFKTSKGKTRLREGSKSNIAPLKRSFERLGFSVQIKEDLNCGDVKKCMKIYSQMDHTRFDCFVCCISSHGNEAGVEGVDGVTVNLDKIISYFSAKKCLSLAGKPKLFFISTCRGRNEMPGVNMAHTDCIQKTSLDLEICIPNEADFVLGYATVPKYVSYRDTTKGTYYLEELANVLDEYGHREEIHDLLTRVNAAVSSRFYQGPNGKVYTQMPAPQYTLRKKLFFSLTN